MARCAGEEAMTKELKELVEYARKIEMTPEQITAQRQSFTYGNTHIENDRITREMVAEADRRIKEALAAHFGVCR
jgi:hypothetical protein